uniref:Bor family protein n=1 Tax=Escherichia coli TaxID=562 RepID=UPI002A59F41A|nr:Bor family protein [Escherichia coli]WPB10780.1 lipoprotein bor [Escherichia coli]
MKKMLFSATLAILITGCAQQTFTVGNKPTAVTPKETITHFFVSGIGQKKTVDAAKICGGAENVVKTETQQTFVNGLLGFYHFCIYTPLEARVYCSQ